jgi:hypothetical protein
MHARTDKVGAVAAGKVRICVDGCTCFGTMGSAMGPWWWQLARRRRWIFVRKRAGGRWRGECEFVPVDIRIGAGGCDGAVAVEICSRVCEECVGGRRGSLEGMCVHAGQTLSGGQGMREGAR